MTEGPSRIQELLDRADLDALVGELGRCLDTKDFDGMARLYTADATFTMPGGSGTGAAAIADAARRGHETFSETQHFIAPRTVEMDGDRAEVVANVLAACNPVDTSETRMLGSRYELTAMRGADGWRFSAHVITAVWDLSRP